ncbi:MAG TPA: HEAT repeat domain-containing protein [Gemmatimonadales bacterium]|jgi:hypothetical protein
MTDHPTLSHADEKLLQALRHLPDVPPTPGLPAAFHRRLEAQASAGRPIGPWVLAALAAALLIALGAGWWVDRNRREAEIADLRAELTNALRNLPAPGRFEAVNQAGNSNLRDDRVVEALTHALLTDPNTNVRVAAADALGRVANAQSLADAARRSLGAERSPFVQSAMLQNLQRLSGGERAQIVERFLGRRDLDPTVRSEAEQGGGL